MSNKTKPLVIETGWRDLNDVVRHEGDRVRLCDPETGETIFEVRVNGRSINVHCTRELVIKPCVSNSIDIEAARA